MRRQSERGGRVDEQMDGDYHNAEAEDEEENDEDDDDEDDDDEDDSDVDDSEDDERDRKVFAAAATRSTPGIPSPAHHDIICGRGKMTSSHPGNRRFRELVMEKKQAYQRARRRDDKTRITFELVQTLRDGGSKFLLYDSKTELWWDVGDEYAREKVSHSLRSRPSENRRSKPKPPRKSSLRKNPQSPAIDKTVSQLIHNQQSLLKSMIENFETGRTSANG